MDVEAEVLQQLAPLGRVGLAVASDVVDGLDKTGGVRSTRTSQPVVSRISLSTAPRRPTASPVIANERDFAKAGIEVGA